VEGRLKWYKLLKAKEMDRAVGCRVRVLSSHHLPVIYATDKKTDKEDRLKLAHLAADRPDRRLPIVPVPGDTKLEKRKVLSSYRRAQENRTRAINRLHGLFVQVGITTVAKKDLAEAEGRREMIRQLSGFEREEAAYQGIPGVGPKIAYAFTAHVGVERFEHAGQVSNYPGLTPRVYMSGSLVRYGHITRHGKRVSAGAAGTGGVGAHVVEGRGSVEGTV
jgi:transposase